MVDFRKRLNKKVIEKKSDPIEIYESLDRRSVTGPLRPAQNKILKDWFDTRKGEKDLIIKLHTGEGKTLIGLLILQSRINSNEGPCLFICPNKYLAQQVRKDAKKFGIQYCTINADNTLPNEFLDGKQILITHVQKVFNGKTIFGLDNNYISIENIILDDSHACIDSIKSSFTITLKRNHSVFEKLLTLFKDSLPEQGEGTFLEIENGDYSSFLPIPYWNWMDKSEEVLNILSKHREESVIAFAWTFIKDNIKNCQAFISGKTIEIAPIYIPIEKFSFFDRAKQRILMSATTQDDSFFIKGLGFTLEAVNKPLNNPSQIWSGEKMLIVPSLIDDSLDRVEILHKMTSPSSKKYGIVSLVSSFTKSEYYSTFSALIPESEEIPTVIDNLKKGNFEKTVVLTNRYDGIDLPDETCRILILDGKPFFYSLADKYEESNRLSSDSINIKIAQKIEQGLGRAVRGEKDYCIVLIIGADLVKFIKSSITNKYFSSQTKKQISIGMEIAEMASEDVSKNKSPFEVVKSLMKQSLQRDEGWKEYYKEEMNEITNENSKNKMHNILFLERKAAILNESGEYQKATNVIQEIIDKHCEIESERGWYLQLMARYTYLLSKIDSNRFQKNAFAKNKGLLKPSEGITYKKLEFIHENRVRRIREWMSAHQNFEGMMISVEGVLSDLEFGTSSEKFEMALKDLGLMIGFLSERPDKEIKKGPDNLWCGVGNQYFIFECKTEVDINRVEINKHEGGQMNTHCGWFENQYGCDSLVERILIIPTKKLSYHAEFTHDVVIMRRGKLKKLRENVKAFFKEFNKYNIKSVTAEKLQELINIHDLDIDSLKTKYSEKYQKNKD